ncbi:MAG: Spy/CpxP family protein refolding chaperone [Deltaproteobacteria bacterium]
MGIGTVVLVCIATFFALGAIRRAVFWRLRGGRGACRGGSNGHRRGGFFIERLLSELGATPEQRTKVSELHAQMGELFSSVRDGRRSLLTKLVDGLPADELDAEALERAATELFGKVSGQLRKAVVELHRTLTPMQRQRLAELARRRLQPC